MSADESLVSPDTPSRNSPRHGSRGDKLYKVLVLLLLALIAFYLRDLAGVARTLDLAKPLPVRLEGSQPMLRVRSGFPLKVEVRQQPIRVRVEPDEEQDSD